MFNKYLCLVFVFFLKLNLIFAENKLPLVINTWNFSVATEAAWTSLQHGDSGLDALVNGLTACEDDKIGCRYSVGYGGTPNEDAETTLDAMLIDGSNMNIGAVGGLRYIKNAAKVARMVMEHTGHTLLVGDSATEFAEIMGFHRENLSSLKSRKEWIDWRNENCQPNFWHNVIPDANKHCGPYKPNTNSLNSINKRYKYDKISESNHDTIGLIVIDEHGKIFAGSSTNGLAFKLAGRVGDSAIPGSGAYADSEVGAAATTGDGDILMRFLPSLLAVESLRAGLTPEEAIDKSLNKIFKYYPEFKGAMVVADRWGNYSSKCVGIDNYSYSVASKNTKNVKVEFIKCKPNTRMLVQNKN